MWFRTAESPQIVQATLETEGYTVLSMPTRLARLASRLVPMRRPDRPSELKVLAIAQGAVDFRLLAPNLVPIRYSLDRVDLVPNSRDLAILIYEGGGRRSFRLSVRSSLAPLRDELLLSNTPHMPIEYAGREYALVSGGYVGEPVDVWHWHTTRRSIAWEQEGLICELEEVIDSGPSLWISFRVAASTTFVPVVAAGTIKRDLLIVGGQVRR